MRKIHVFLLGLTGLLAAFPAGGQPRLEAAGYVTRLVVEGEPFIIRGGELGNSSASSMDYMEAVWPQLAAMNVNTVLAPVYWELIEPAEGNFDFTLVDALIEAARERDQKLVLLWFGAWKNSMSSYVPAWVKQDEARFPRGRGKDGETEEILTAFSRANLEADKAAFAALMRHVERVDGNRQTVIRVQVENEVGTLSKDNPESVLRMGDWVLTCRHDYTLGWSPEAANEDWPHTAAIIVRAEPATFCFAGTGVVITVAPADDESLKAGILHAEEGHFEDGAWHRGRVLNGDQTHQGRHLRIPGGDFRIHRFSLYEYGRFGEQ